MYDVFDKSRHLQPIINKEEFDSLHGFDFGWLILEPINIAEYENEDELLSLRFSPGQKAIYFFWYLDAAVTNGGFSQFYWNGYRRYIDAIAEGLKLIGDEDMLELVYKVDTDYVTNKDFFEQQPGGNGLYKKLGIFEKYDQQYYKLNDKTMSLIEEFARKNSQDFVRFT